MSFFGVIFPLILSHAFKHGQSNDMRLLWLVCSSLLISYYMECQKVRTCVYKASYPLTLAYSRTLLMPIGFQNI